MSCLAGWSVGGLPIRLSAGWFLLGIDAAGWLGGLRDGVWSGQAEFGDHRYDGGTVGLRAPHAPVTLRITPGPPALQASFPTASFPVSGHAHLFGFLRRLADVEDRMGYEAYTR